MPESRNQISFFLVAFLAVNLQLHEKQTPAQAFSAFLWNTYDWLPLGIILDSESAKGISF